MAAASRYSLTKPRLLHLLGELNANSVEIASVCVPSGTSKTDAESMMASILDLKTTPEDLIELAAESRTGAFLFWGPNHKYLVMPPFPVAGASVSVSCEIESLSSLLKKDILLGLIMVRLGEYAIGVFQGEKLLSSNTGTGLVHARHRQGGSSSHRFVRHREKQMEIFFTRVCQHARQQLEPYARQMDYIIYGGARETVQDFRKQCRFMQAFDGRTLYRLLNVREPKQSGFTEGIQEAWSSQVIKW